MEVYTSLVIAIIGAYFYDIDFLVLYDLAYIAIALYKSYHKNTNDKTTNG